MTPRRKNFLTVLFLYGILPAFAFILVRIIFAYYSDTWNAEFIGSSLAIAFVFLLIGYILAIRTDKKIQNGEAE